MSFHGRSLSIVLAVAFAGLALQGCPPPLGPPPFDVTGIYDGTFVPTNPGFGMAPSGPMSLELYHYPQSPFIPNTFAGLVSIDWDTLLPPLVQQLLGITEDFLVVPVLANLQPDGSYELNISINGTGIPPELAGDVDMHEATSGLESTFQQFQLTFAGTGADNDGDGAMDVTNGTFSALLEYLDAQQKPIRVEFDGTYQATFTSMPSP